MFMPLYVESGLRLKSTSMAGTWFEFRMAASGRKNGQQGESHGPPRRKIRHHHRRRQRYRPRRLAVVAKEGAKLIAVDRSESVQETEKLVSDAGGTIECHEAGRRFGKRCQDLHRQGRVKYGRLDAIWANAGVSGGLVPLADQDGGALDGDPAHQPDRPVSFAIKYATPHMIAQKSGSIVCTASVAGLNPARRGIPMAPARPASSAWCRPPPIRCPAPGCASTRYAQDLIETGMTKPIFDNARSRGTDHKIGQLNPLKRAGQPHELAAMGLFLASDEASYVNGQAIPVDGGLTASMPYAGETDLRCRTSNQ